MTAIIDAIRGLFRGIQCWVLVAPWEQGLRVRLGRWVKRLNAGPHLRIPFVDRVYLQSVRLRVSAIGKQTLTTLDGKTLTIGGSIGYCVEDIETVYRELHHAEDTIQQLSRAAIAEYITRRPLADCTAAQIEAHVSGTLNFKRFGLGCPAVYVTDFAVVRTYRLIGDQQYSTYGSTFSTEAQH